MNPLLSASNLVKSLSWVSMSPQIPSNPNKAKHYGHINNRLLLEKTKSAGTRSDMVSKPLRREALSYGFREEIILSTSTLSGFALTRYCINVITRDEFRFLPNSWIRVVRPLAKASLCWSGCVAVPTRTIISSEKPACHSDHLHQVCPYQGLLHVCMNGMKTFTYSKYARS